MKLEQLLKIDKMILNYELLHVIGPDQGLQYIAISDVPEYKNMSSEEKRKNIF